MKSFSAFIQEAVISRAVEKAKRLGLVSDGHGNWYDRQGRYKGRTYKGDLLLSKGREGKKEDLLHSNRHLLLLLQKKLNQQHKQHLNHVVLLAKVGKENNQQEVVKH